MGTSDLQAAYEQLQEREQILSQKEADKIAALQSYISELEAYNALKARESAYNRLSRNYDTTAKSAEQMAQEATKRHNDDLKYLNDLVGKKEKSIIDSFVRNSTKSLAKINNRTDIYLDSFKPTLDAIKSSENYKELGEYLDAAIAVQPKASSDGIFKRTAANDMTDMRGKIKDVIDKYNNALVKQNKDKKLPNTFIALTELAEKNSDKYESALATISGLLSNNNKGDNTEEQLYLTNYDKYIKCYLHFKKVPVEKLANDFVKQYNDNNLTLKDLPAFDDIVAKKENVKHIEKYSDYIDKLLMGHNARLNALHNDAVSNTATSSLDDMPLTIASVQEYAQKNQWFAEQSKIVYGTAHHDKRVTIRKYIEEYNIQNNDKAKLINGIIVRDLPKTFKDLRKLSQDEYNACSVVIRDIVNTNNDPETIQFFDLFDTVHKTKQELARTKKCADLIISNENNVRAQLRNGDKGLDKAANYELGPDAFYNHLEEKSKAMRERFEEDLKNAEKANTSAQRKLNILGTVQNGIHSLTAKSQDITAAVCLAEIKGSLKSTEDKIAKLEKQEKQMEEAIRADEILLGTNTINAVKGISNDTSQRTENGVVALKNDNSNNLASNSVDIAKRLANRALELEKLKSSIKEAKLDYQRKLDDMKLDAAKKLDEIFGTKKADTLDDVAALKSAETEELSANEFNVLKSELEQDVNLNSQGILAKAKRQIKINNDMRQQAQEEAEEKHRAKKLASKSERADERSELIAKFFKPENINTINLVINTAKSAYDAYKSFTGDSDSNDEPVPISDSLDNIASKLNGALNPDAKTDDNNVVASAVNLVSAFCNFSKRLDGVVSEKYQEAVVEAENSAVILQSKLQQKKSLAEALEAYSGKKEDTVFLYANAKHCLNADLANIYTAESEAEFVKDCAAEAKKRRDEITEQLTERKARLDRMETELGKNVTDTISAKNAVESARNEVNNLQAEQDKRQAEANQAKENVRAHESWANAVLNSKGDSVETVTVDKATLDADEKLRGIRLLTQLTDVSFEQSMNKEQLKQTLDAININGLSATQYFNVTNMFENKDTDLVDLTNKCSEIGDTLRSYFDKALANADELSKQGPQIGDALSGAFISIEGKNGLLKPVILNKRGIESIKEPPAQIPEEPKKPDEPHYASGILSGKRNKQLQAEYNKQMEAYTAAMEGYSRDSTAYTQTKAAYENNPSKNVYEYNKACLAMCKDLNEARHIAATAKYNESDISAMSDNEKKQNIRRITLDQAVAISRGERLPSKLIDNAKAASRSKTHSTPEKSMEKSLDMHS